MPELVASPFLWAKTRKSHTTFERNAGNHGGAGVRISRINSRIEPLNERAIPGSAAVRVARFLGSIATGRRDRRSQVHGDGRGDGFHRTGSDRVRHFLGVRNAEHKWWDESSRQKNIFSTLQIAQKDPKFSKNQPLTTCGGNRVLGAARESGSSGRIPEAGCQNLPGLRFHLLLSSSLLSPCCL